MRTTKFLFFYVFFPGVCKPCNEPETSGDKARIYQKTSLLFITRFLYWTFLYLLSLFGILSRYLFVLTYFDSSRQQTHSTTNARDNTRDRDSNSSRQNDVTWCDFLQGKQVELSLPRSLLLQKTEKIYRSRFVYERGSTHKRIYKTPARRILAPFFSSELFFCSCA